MEVILCEEFYELIEFYGEVVLWVKKVGVDVVEVYCVYGYLVSSFLFVWMNKCVDEFGGCFENWMWLFWFIIESICKCVGYFIVIFCWINSMDGVEGGLSV